MTNRQIVPAVIAVLSLVSPGVALSQVASPAPEQADVAGPPPARFRIILNGAFWPGASTTFGDIRVFDEYVEQTTIRTGYETESSFGPELAVQVNVYQDFGVLASYSRSSRDVSGSVDVSRPHPLHFDRHRTASGDLTGYGYSESAIHLDLAYGRGAGHLDWSLFGGVTLFRVEADLLGRPTFDDTYPYDELAIVSTPATTTDASPTGFNVGGRIDYRFGRSGRFGVGVQILYSAATAELQANADAQVMRLDVGGLEIGAGVRLYF